MIEAEALYPALVRRLSRDEPDKEILREVTGRRVTFVELQSLADRWADAVDSVVHAGGATVATLLPAGIDYVAITLGIGWSRAIEVGVNTAYKGRILRHVLEDSGSTALIVHERYLEQLAVTELPDCLEAIIVVPGDGLASLPANSVWADEVLPASPAVNDRPDPRADDIAWIIYTSGTTGPSKGVLCTWAQTYLTATGSHPVRLLTPEDVYYSDLPMFHVAGRLKPYISALIGGRCVIRESFSTKHYWSDIATHGCTTTQLFPAMQSFLMAEPARADDALTPLRNVLLAPLTSDIEEFMQRFGVRLCTTWNMTETSSPIVSPGFDLVNGTSCGRVRPGYHVRIVDEHDNEVEPGEFGELVVRADEPHALMAGYYRHPEKTVESWRDLWFHSGDGFTLDEDGNYYYVDRLKDALRRRGENISSSDVEADILTHPAVNEAAVVGVPSAEGEQEVMAYVVLHPGRSMHPSELISHLEPIMPKFMLPRYVEVLDELPRTPTFRVQKHVLRDRGVGEHTWDRHTMEPSR